MIIGLKQTTLHRPPVIGPQRSGMCGKNWIAHVFWSQTLKGIEITNVRLPLHLVYSKCFMQSWFLGGWAITVGNDVVTEQELPKGQKQGPRWKLFGFGGRSHRLGCLTEDKSFNSCEPQLPHSQNDHNASPVPAAHRNMHFWSSAMIELSHVWRPPLSHF